MVLSGGVAWCDFQLRDSGCKVEDGSMGVGGGTKAKTGRPGERLL